MPNVTIILAVRGSDGIVVGADSRSCAGTAFIDGTEKITQLASNCCVGVAGDSASAGIPFVRDAVRNLGLSSDRPADVHEVGRALERLLNERINAGSNGEVKALNGTKFILAGSLMGTPSFAVNVLHSSYTAPRFVLHDSPEGFNKIGECQLATYFETLLDVRYGAVPCERLAPLVHFVLSETAAMRFTVARPFQMVIVRRDSVEPIDCAKMEALSEGTRSSMSRIIQHVVLPAAPKG